MVITGAGSGFGAAIARRAAEMGAKVCVSDLDGDKALGRFGAIEVESSYKLV
ncbi:MAG: SDR family NAD(P)-dependent oxidoreductase [Pseudomonadota bacterium]